MLRALLRPSRYPAHVRYFWARWQLRQRGLIEQFAKRPNSAIPPSYFDLWYLYRSARGCSRMIEFGIGCSTIVLAQALHDQGGGELISIDASAIWIEETRKTFPSSLQPFVKFHHSPVAPIEYGGERCHRYADVPAVSPELVYLDGPSPHDVPGWQGAPLAADPLLLDLQPGAVIIVDSRPANVAFLRRHLRQPFRSVTDRTFGVTTFTLG